jgi:hypothetical protein
VYIRTCNLIIDASNHIQNPCLLGGVGSGSCHRCKEKRERTFGVCVMYIPGQGVCPPFRPVNRVET